MARICAALVVIGALTAAGFAQQPAFLSVRLRSEGKKSPVANATLELSAKDTANVVKLTSDDKGRATRAGLRPGMYRLRVACSGYRSVQIDGLELKSNDRREIVLELAPTP
jgi:hypothetical protein